MLDYQGLKGPTGLFKPQDGAFSIFSQFANMLQVRDRFFKNYTI